MGLLGEYTGFQDMFDGGGAGQSGPTFEGGPLSDALNALGVRPHGYRRREAAADRGGVNPTRSVPVTGASPAPVRPVVNPVGPINRDYGFSGVSGVNPVSPYGEAARFGLLAPEPYKVYSGRGYAGMPIQPELGGYHDELSYLRSLEMVNY